MNIYKLKYTDKEAAIADLKAKGVYTLEDLHESEQTLSYGQGVQAIVEIGKVIQIQGTYDEEGNVITEPIYYDGYAYDVMSEQDIYFEREIFPNSPNHSFAGYEDKLDITLTEIE